MYIGILNSLGIIFALGHFYFAYKYHIKKNGLLKTLILFLLSMTGGYLILFSVRHLAAFNSALLFSSIVIFLFTLHHYFDLYKFKNYKSAIFWLIYGLILTFLFTVIESSYHKSVVYSLIWVMVFHHYFYWIYLSFKNFANKKPFIIDVIISHIVIALVFIINYFYVDSLYLNILYSLSVFYFLTLVHVIFSFLKDLYYLYGK